MLLLGVYFEWCCTVEEFRMNEELDNRQRWLVQSTRSNTLTNNRATCDVSVTHPCPQPILIRPRTHRRRRLCTQRKPCQTNLTKRRSGLFLLAAPEAKSSGEPLQAALTFLRGGGDRNQALQKLEERDRSGQGLWRVLPTAQNTSPYFRSGT